MSPPTGRTRRANVSQLFDTLQKEAPTQALALTNSVGVKLVQIPAGTFTIGSRTEHPFTRLNETPAHPVILTQPYYMAAHPVTQEQYRAVMGTNPSRFTPAAGGGPNHPVERVSHADAIAFCRALSNLPKEKEVGREYRLPTEAEWENACRAGGDATFAYGETLTSPQANFDARDPKKGVFDYLERTSKVGDYPANHFGLHDMHGNVWEWCLDWYGENFYAVSPDRDPQGPAEGRFRVVRGGCWRSRSGCCRSAYRNALLPHNRDPYTGFRVVCRIAKGE